MRVRNISSHVVDLDSGRTLAPGEVADTDTSDRVTELIDADQLADEDDDAPAAPPALPLDLPVEPAAAALPPEPASDAPGTTVTEPTPMPDQTVAEAPTDPAPESALEHVDTSPEADTSAATTEKES